MNDEMGEISSAMDHPHDLYPGRNWPVEDQIGSMPKRTQIWMEFGPTSADERPAGDEPEGTTKVRSKFRRARRIVGRYPVMNVSQIAARVVR